MYKLFGQICTCLLSLMLSQFAAHSGVCDFYRTGLPHS
ncbi:hypothetical protein EC180200_3207 [Escherichia coli 180200]|nr:hypothetical protein EC2866450_5115 [Escherichia coli 2866450]ENA65580.1 hypothetical protein EC180200_3207 [Escherichia coli 180200]